MKTESIVRQAVRKLTLQRGSRVDRGASLVEYALLVGLIAAVCVLAVTFFGGETSDSLSRTASEIGSS